MTGAAWHDPPRGSIVRLVRLACAWCLSHMMRVLHAIFASTNYTPLPQDSWLNSQVDLGVQWRSLSSATQTGWYWSVHQFRPQKAQTNTPCGQPLSGQESSRPPVGSHAPTPVTTVPRLQHLRRPSPDWELGGARSWDRPQVPKA